MVNIIKTKIEMDNGLKKKLEFICSFCNVKPIIFNGHIISIEHTNISYVEPHRMMINNITFLFFNYGTAVYVENLKNCVSLKELEKFINKIK